MGTSTERRFAFFSAIGAQVSRFIRFGGLVTVMCDVCEGGDLLGGTWWVANVMSFWLWILRYYQYPVQSSL